MTTVGDIVVGDTVSGGVAAPARLGAGASGYMLRSIAGIPAWRELSAAGLGEDRQVAAANREGQTYWSTDAAAGSELAMCVHKGGATYAWEILAYGAPGLPVATGAGEVPLSTGAGTTYAAANLGDEVSAVLANALGSEPAGTAIVGDGAGDITTTSADVSAVLAAADAAAARAALGVGGAPTSGTLGARAASPAAGAVYYATDYDVTLVCAVAGTWRVMAADKVGVSLGPTTAAAAYTASGIVSASPGTAVGPTLAGGQSIALGFWMDSVPTTEQVIASYQTSANGWIIALNGTLTSGYMYVLRHGITGPGAAAKVDLGTQAVLVGANTLAIDFAANDLSFTWSLNGGAAATIVTSDSYTPPAANAHFVLGNYQMEATVPLIAGSLSWAQAWSTLLGGATLATVSGAYLSLLPGNPGAATCTYAWMAARAPSGSAQHDAIGNATPLTINGANALRRVRRL
jgi:hypothetical protein